MVDHPSEITTTSFLGTSGRLDCISIRLASFKPKRKTVFYI